MIPSDNIDARIETAAWLMERAKEAQNAADAAVLPQQAHIHQQAANRWLKLARIKGRAQEHTAVRSNVPDPVADDQASAVGYTVSDDALNALWGDDAGADHRVSLLSEYEHILAKVAQGKRLAGRVEDDGSVVITAQDILN